MCFLFVNLLSIFKTAFVYLLSLGRRWAPYSSHHRQTVLLALHYICSGWPDQLIQSYSAVRKYWFESCICPLHHSFWWTKVLMLTIKRWENLSFFLVTLWLHNLTEYLSCLSEKKFSQNIALYLFIFSSTMALMHNHGKEGWNDKKRINYTF